MNFKEGFGGEVEIAPQPIPAIVDDSDKCDIVSKVVDPQILSASEMSTIGLLKGSPPNMEIGFWLRNGGRLYQHKSDTLRGRLEYASPECRDLKEIGHSMYCGAYLAFQCFQKVDRIVSAGHKHTVIVSNGDHTSTRLMTTVHESYTIPEALKGIPRQKLAEWLMAYVVTRQIITGSGFIDHDGKFFLSPSAQSSSFDAAERDKDRLHLRMGDNNMSPEVIMLKFGMTMLMLQALALGWEPKTLTTAQGRQDAKAVSRIDPRTNPSFEFVSSTGRESALDAQFQFLEVAKKFFGSSKDPDTVWTIGMWRQSLNALADDPLKANWLDWPNKYSYYLDDQCIYTLAEKIRLDRSYHYWDLTNRKMSVYPTIGRTIPSAEEILHAMYNPPQSTRANTRSTFVRTLLDQKLNTDSAYVNWHKIGYNGKSIELPLDQSDTSLEPLFT